MRAKPRTARKDSGQHGRDLLGQIRELGLAGLRAGWARSRLLTAAGLVNLGLIPLFGVAIFLNPQWIRGAPAWTKPLKFAISIGIYSLTIVWLLQFIDGRAWLKRLLANATGGALLLEQSLIVIQVLRGTTSHFNYATVFDAAVFQVMGAGITIVAVINLVIAIWLGRQKVAGPVLGWALRLGVAITFLGMLVAFLMVSPTTGQLEAIERGETPSTLGAHAVGVEDGGPGLPILGWSTEGGDLRVPHFVGLHALQALPFLAYLLGRPRAVNRWTQRQRTGMVLVAGMAYSGMLGLLTWQALRGQSVLRPDGLTLAAAAALLIGAGFAFASIASWPNRRRERSLQLADGGGG